MEKKRTLYLDVVKAAAICAVLTDHFRVLFPSPQLAGCISYFSVSSFIIVAGITTYYSIPRHADKILRGGYYKHRLGSLFCTYLVASFILYSVSFGNAVSDVHEFLITLISFNMPGASYYVVLYTQLILISPLIFVLIRKCVKSRFPFITVCALLIATLYVGYVSTMKGIQLPYYGGAHYLLGGSYLFLFTFGMTLAAFDIPQKILRFGFGNLLAPISACVAFRCCLQIGWTVKPFEGWQLNPPGLILMWYAISVVWCISAFVQFFERYELVAKCILQPVATIGRYSLDIFLFHNVVYLLIAAYMPQTITGRIRNILLFVLPIVVPMLGRKIYTALKKWVVTNLKSDL